MYVIGAIVIAFLLPFGLVKRGVHWSRAWLASCIVVPLSILVAEFVIPHGMRGWMLQMALWLGALWSVAVGGLGTFIASRLEKKPKGHDA